jgi:8-hydroxy-5-deazaflavin:NADPH oxidoreductase
MRIGVLGTGLVGTTIASKLVELGHDVRMGSRTADNEKAAAWVASAGERASAGTFADAAAFGDLNFNCTSGAASLEALGRARADNLARKTLVDVANHLDLSEGYPRVVVDGRDSLAEQIQRAFPDARVVKSLNTMNCQVMVDPGRVPGEHDVFVCGDDEDRRPGQPFRGTRLRGVRGAVDPHARGARDLRLQHPRRALATIPGCTPRRSRARAPSS